jgi:prepilin-type N-terminal cleavage/methylation domain-containing protein
MAKSTSCLAKNSANNATPGSSLHHRSRFSHRSRVSGFTLIEVLIVVLVMGVLFGTGLSVYSGVTRDSQLRTRTDELTSFFAACRHRAVLRQTPVKFIYENGFLGTDQSHNLRQRINEVDVQTANKIFNNLSIDNKGIFMLNDQPINHLQLPVTLPGGHSSSITVGL